MTVPALWTKHRNIAYTIAHEWRVPGMDQDDIAQEALIALWDACRRHDKTRGPFPPFARMVIKARMVDLLRAATTQGRTAELEYDVDVPGPDLETQVVQRETLFELATDPIARQQRAWREAKRRQRATA